MSLRRLGWLVHYNLYNHPISFLLAPNGPLRGPEQEDTFRCPVKGFVILLFLEEHNHWLAGQPAFPYLILPFFCRKPSTSGVRTSQQPPRTSPLRKKGRLVGRSFSVRERVTAQIFRASRRPSLAGHMCSKTLMSCSPH